MGIGTLPMPFTVLKTAKVAIAIRKSEFTLPVEQIVIKLADITITVAISICATATMLTVFPLARVRVCSKTACRTKTVSPKQT